MRAAVYTGTKNLYQFMIASAKSLLMHSNVEQIYFLIEDDIFPYELPPKTVTINVRNQKYFDPHGPNFKSEFTYMALMRIPLTKIFPDLDIILSLDVDTIVNENISNLWDLDITNYYFAAARQPIKCTENFLDINAGVMLINLKKLRQDKKDDEIINYINSTYEIFPEQNAINKLCQGYILELPSDYNYNDSTDFNAAKSRKITHYAGNHEWQKYPIFQKYMNIPNDKIIFNKTDKIGLDIIIPSYNDKDGLIRTLRSIYYPELNWINITVIDDASEVDYTDIIKEFPINLIKLKENKGPGNARKIGILNTQNPYIIFVDCGDIILSKFCLLAIKEQLDNYRVLDIYEWSWINGDKGAVSNPYETSTPGKIYRREFLEIYNIYPYDNGQGSYAAEDCSFNFICYSIIKDYEYVEYTPHIKHYLLPIYKSIVNNNSLTFKNDKDFLYTSIPGITDNGIYYVELCKKANIRPEIIMDYTNLFMVDLYQYFLRTIKHHPESLEKYWKNIQNFYLEAYKKYESSKENDDKLTICFSQRIKTLKKIIPNPNIRRFIQELNENEKMPERYYEYY